MFHIFFFICHLGVVYYSVAGQTQESTQAVSLLLVYISSLHNTFNLTLHYFLIYYKLTSLYGTDPNNAATWDADRVFGCSCDVGYEGYDCSLRTCPIGININDDDDSEQHTCSNHGVCDHSTGKCQCFSGWGSSDGSGSLGPNNDCGSRLKLRGYP